MPIDFTAIDFETANSHGASACSVGLIKVRDGRVVDRAGWFIRPPYGYDDFLEWNTRIHGIRKEDVSNALGWAEQLGALMAFAEDDHLVAHNAGFDMSVIKAASAAVEIDCPEYSYLCSLQLARKTYTLDSYRLPSVAMAAGFEDFKHHDASADAEACAAIVVHAAKRYGVTNMAELGEAAGVAIKRLAPALATR